MKKQSHVLRNDHDRAAMVRFMEVVTLEKPLRVTIEEDRRKRTSNQNALYWEWLGLASRETGYSANELHEYCKERYCPAVEIGLGGVSKFVRSTARLNTVEMTDYMDRVYALFAGEMGVVLPLPVAA